MERFLTMLRAQGEQPQPGRRGIAAIALGAQARTVLAQMVAQLRRRLGVPVFAEYQERKLLAQLKIADRNRARFALIVGNEELAAGEVVLRDLERRSDQRLPLDAAKVVAALPVESRT